MEIKNAGDIMIPLDRYPHIPYWFTLRQAMAEMESWDFEIDGRKSLHRALLVFNESYELLGLIRPKEVLRGLEVERLANTPMKASGDKGQNDAAGEFFARAIQDIRRMAERPVSDMMLPITATVERGDHIIKVIHEMVESNLDLLPVLEEGKVAGVARYVDVFHEVAHLLLS